MLTAIAVLGALLAAPLQTARPNASDVAWMSGCGDLTRNGRHVSEYWMAAEGGTLIGMARTVANAKTIEWEFMLIRETAAGLEYVATPSGQPEAIFTAARVSSSEVVFENPAHDSPQRILYRRDGDVLTAAIEGPMNGQTRRVEFVYRKAACGG
jgi:hypothetical protein